MFRRVKDNSTQKVYTNSEIGKMVEFLLIQSGNGSTEVTRMLNSLKKDREEFYSELVEIADSDGNISIDEIRDLVLHYEFIRT